MNMAQATQGPESLYQGQVNTGSRQPGFPLASVFMPWGAP